MKPILNTRTAALFLAFVPMLALADPAKRALTVEAHVVPTTLRLAGQIEISAVLTNIDPSRQVVLRGEPGWTAAGGFSIEVTDASGNRRLAKPQDGGITLEQASTGSRRFMLGPGFGYGTSRVVDAKALFPAPGSYTLRVLYQAPRPASGQGNGQGALEGETASSDAVSVRVIH